MQCHSQSLPPLVYACVHRQTIDSDEERLSLHSQQYGRQAEGDSYMLIARFFVLPALVFGFHALNILTCQHDVHHDNRDDEISETRPLMLSD